MLEVRTSGDLSLTPTLQEFGDVPMGRGARGAIPNHVTYEAKDIDLRAGKTRAWEITFDASAMTHRMTHTMTQRIR
jgi:hypothetical protein